MIGYRTRLAQETREHWHLKEDWAIERSLGLAKKMDEKVALLTVLIPRGWLVLSLIGLIPIAIYNNHSTIVLAVGLGASLLAFRALRRFTVGISHIAGAAIAWQHVAPFFHNTIHPEANGKPTVDLLIGSDNLVNQMPLLDARNLVFRYHNRHEHILQRCSLSIHTGDRLLLEGLSGSGKSTLAALLAGLRIPESEQLLLQGVDKQSLGASNWRRQVALVPQFHENYVFAETFAFNLLMGRRWPPRSEDLEEAEAICHEIGLGDLLNRMPSGIMQMVGESGWQLSHGERSRLYIARALLQNATLIIFDESFAALDPETLHQTLLCVLKRATTFLVVAHL